MKRKVISMIGLALFVGVVVFNFQMNSKNNTKLKNTEALAAGINGIVTCYSSLEIDEDATVYWERYDCGPCEKRDHVVNWADQGNCDY